MDLTKEGEFELAGLRVRPALRQVDSPGGSETLEPRIMQVLVALARRRGDVVSRDQLIEECWDGLAVGEDSISRCIYRLRKLGESTGAFRLETITKVGYRLMEPVRPAEAPARLPAAGLAAESSKQRVGAAPPRRKLAIWLAAGGAAVAVLLAVVLFRPQGSPDIEQVVGRLTERLQQERGASHVATASNAMRQLGSSSRPEEKSAFAALASDDGEHALDILEELARQLEASGDTSAAAEAYGRLGAIAALFDSARAVVAQQRAFELNPNSLRSFQSSFFIGFLKGTNDSVIFADRVLADPRLSERMRGWVLSHRAFIEAGEAAINDKADLTVAETKALPTFASDPTLQASALWIEGVIASTRGDMRSALEFETRASELWGSIPEKTSNSAEVQMIRAMYELGDWEKAFELGAAAFDRRSREGDLLPASVTWVLCEAGVLTDQPQKALPFCLSSVRRREGAPAMLKGHAALAAFIEGDDHQAAMDIESAHALAPPAGSMPAIFLIYEAWIAARSGDLELAEDILSRKPGGVSWDEATKRRPAVLAMARRLLGEWRIKAGEPKRACAPLAEAEGVYASYGADEGRDAVRVLLNAAGCPPD